MVTGFYVYNCEDMTWYNGRGGFDNHVSQGYVYQTEGDAIVGGIPYRHLPIVVVYIKIDFDIPKEWSDR